MPERFSPSLHPQRRRTPTTRRRARNRRGTRQSHRNDNTMNTLSKPAAQPCRRRISLGAAVSPASLRSAAAGLGTEFLRVFVGDVLPRVGVFGIRLFAGNVWPTNGVVAVQLNPSLGFRLTV